MADTLEHDTSIGPHEARAGTPGRLTFAVGIEDLGTLSFAPFLLLGSALLLSPLGAYSIICMCVGAATIWIGAQMVMRRPYIALPEHMRNIFVQNVLLQAAVKAALHRLDQPDDELRRRRHWITLEPFDLLPRTLLVFCGGLIMISAPFAGMPRVLGIAMIALTISLHARKPYWLLAGAFLTSLACITPLFGG